MRPFIVSTAPRLSRAFSRTTVLATDSDRPNTRPAPRLHPHDIATAMPSTVAAAICAMAPGKAILRTAIRSSIEKCRPTPNISSITPISDSWAAISMSATKPGMPGPINTPASR
jgi:hypothetical protein